MSLFIMLMKHYSINMFSENVTQKQLFLYKFMYDSNEQHIYAFRETLKKWRPCHCCAWTDMIWITVFGVPPVTHFQGDMKMVYMASISIMHSSLLPEGGGWERQVWGKSPEYLSVKRLASKGFDHARPFGLALKNVACSRVSRWVTIKPDKSISPHHLALVGQSDGPMERPKPHSPPPSPPVVTCQVTYGLQGISISFLQLTVRPSVLA